jgi:secreted trypsin-like serine protease
MIAHKKRKEECAIKSRRLLSLIVFIAVLMTTLLTGPAYAISNGQPDGDAHPYVCWVAVWDGVSDYFYVGSGSLIAEKVVLTAGHVTADMPDYVIEYVWVSFDPYAVWSPLSHPEAWKVADSWYTHPQYEVGVYPQLKNWISHDVGIIILEEPVSIARYGELPEEGLVDTLKMKTDVDQVGYGVQEMFHVPGTGPPGWGYVVDGARYYAPAQLIKSNHEFSEEFMKLTANPAQGKGGTCFGDSGGPNLLGGTDIILGVTSWGTNYPCAGVSYVARVDTADVLNWITGEFGDLLEP